MTRLTYCKTILKHNPKAYWISKTQSLHHKPQPLCRDARTQLRECKNLIKTSPHLPADVVLLEGVGWLEAQSYNRDEIRDKLPNLQALHLCFSLMR